MIMQPETVAEAFLLSLRRRGVDYLFGNAGTDFAPVIEAFARADEDGLDVPDAIETIHETLCVGMAHGYYLATGRPQAAMVHVNVGLANAVMGLINASRGQVPMLMASGRTPITEQGRIGSRDVPIHWGQEMFDQGGLVREFVKWDYELRAGEQVVDVVDRALAISRAEPSGPVYLSLPREVLAEPLPAGFTFDRGGGAVPSSPHPDPSAVEAAVALLAEAEQPVVITSGGGPELFEVLGPFAETFAIPVVQFWRTSCAISTEHPFYGGEVPKVDLARADAVVTIESMVPWLPGKMPLRPGARVIQIGSDPLFHNLPVRSFPADIAITSAAAPAVEALHAGLLAQGAADGVAVDRRRDELVPELAARRRQDRAAGADPGGEVMSPHFMSRVIGEVLGPDAIVVNELGLAPSVMDFTRPDSFFGLAISGGLGWGLPAALGIALAQRRLGSGRQVVAAVGDGSYVFANPAACHHMAAAQGLGLLTIVADNRVWNAVRRATMAVYPEGRAVASPTMPLTSLEPAPDYPKLVEAYGGHGEYVDSADDLAPALRRALDVTTAGRQALVAVRCSPNDSR